MKLLLDSHAFIWWDDEPTRLGPSANRACFDPANELLLSVASVWEIQTKVMLAKLRLGKPLRQMIADQVERNGLEILAVNLEHALRLDSSPALHKDPFDRLLIAQAVIEGAALVTHDRAIAQYPVPVIW